MKHVMVDLETLGTVPGCVVLSIGAVEFFPSQDTSPEDALGEEFYTVINIASSKSHYLLESQSTLKWWRSQSADAQAVLTEAEEGGLALPLALEQFNKYLRGIGGVKELRIYGNGADFDNPILEVAYDAAKVKPHWYSYGGRCYRTLKNLDELFGTQFASHKISRGTGTHHNALDDAKAQALHLMEIIANIKKGVK